MLAHWTSVVAPLGFKVPNVPVSGDFYARQTLYFICFDGLTKIGITRDLTARMHQFKLGTPKGLRVRATREIPSVLAKQIERRVHEALAKQAVGREWFKLQPGQGLAAAEPIIRDGWRAFRALDEAGWTAPMVA